MSVIPTLCQTPAAAVAAWVSVLEAAGTRLSWAVKRTDERVVFMGKEFVGNNAADLMEMEAVCEN